MQKKKKKTLHLLPAELCAATDQRAMDDNKNRVSWRKQIVRVCVLSYMFMQETQGEGNGGKWEAMFTRTPTFKLKCIDIHTFHIIKQVLVHLEI